MRSPSVRSSRSRVMYHFEEKWVFSNNTRPSIWFRDVDDTFTFQQQQQHSMFNSFALTKQNWKKQWSLTLGMMPPLTSVLTVNMLTTIRTLRSNDATSTIAWISSDYFESLLLPQLERRLKNWIWILSVFIAIIPTHFVKCRRTLLQLNS